MKAKLTRYFESGVRLIWYIEPEMRTATSYTSPSASSAIAPDGFLDGGEVLPGFRLSLAQLFSRADRQSAARDNE